MTILDKLRREPSHRISDTPGTPADFADLHPEAEKISEISNDSRRASDSEQRALPPLSEVTRARLQLTGTHRHHWMVDGEAVYFPEPVTEEEARGRWTTKQPRTAHQ